MKATAKEKGKVDPPMIRKATTADAASIAGTVLPNEASIALHERSGFRKIGQFREVGSRFNEYIDVGYY